MVLALVLKDDMNLLGSGSTDVGTKHDVVRRISMHIGLVQRAVEQLDVSTVAIDVLLVLHGELNHHRLVHIGEWFELGGHSVELGILAGLHTLVLLGITVELAGSQDEFAGIRSLVCGLDPGI